MRFLNAIVGDMVSLLLLLLLLLLAGRWLGVFAVFVLFGGASEVGSWLFYGSCQDANQKRPDLCEIVT